MTAVEEMLVVSRPTLATLLAGVEQAVANADTALVGVDELRRAITLQKAGYADLASEIRRVLAEDGERR